MLTLSPTLFQALQWRLWLFQLLLWALLLPAYTSWSLAVFALLLLAKLWQLYRNGKPWSLGYSNLLAGGMLLALLLSACDLGVILSPRAAKALVRAGRAYALICGRSFVTADDIRHIFPAVAEHRLHPGGHAGETNASTLLLQQTPCQI